MDVADVAQELFASQTLPRLVNLLADQPGRPMTAGELARALGGANRDSLYRALRRAEGAGLIRRETRGRVSTFEIASESPIYPEVKSLLAKLLGIGPRIREALSGRDDVDQAFLYGSFASGQDTAESDIDLLVLGTVSGLELSTLLRPVIADFEREINVAGYTRAEVEARLGAGDPFFLDVWSKPKVMLIGDEAELPVAPAQAQVGPRFAQEAAVSMLQLSAGYVIGAVGAEPSTELSEGDLDEAETWAHSVRPDAKTQVATAEMGWWQVPAVGVDAPEWQAWLYPGPVLSVRWSLRPREHEEGHLISLVDLTAWWKELSAQLPRLLQSLGCTRARIGLTVAPYGPGARVMGFDFDDLPSPRGVNSLQVPPWLYIGSDFDLPRLPPAQLREAARHLLRHWSYRGIEATLDALQLA